MGGVRPVVTTVPMINLRLPLNLQDNSPVSLDNALAQQQFFLEGNTLVPKYTDLIYSRGVLMFYVDRRASIIRVQNQPPFNMGAFPQPLAGFERLNNKKVDFKPDFLVRESDEYKIRSVIVSEVNSTIENASNQNIVVGSSALIYKHADLNNGPVIDTALIYDPYSVYSNTGGTDPKPFRTMSATPTLDDSQKDFISVASERGVIFVYELTTDTTQGFLQIN